MFAIKTRNRRFALSLLAGILLLLALGVQTASAQEIDVGDIPTDLTDAAAWLASGGVVIAVAAWVRKTDVYQNLPDGLTKTLLGAAAFWALPALSSLLLRMLGMMNVEQLQSAQGMFNWFLTGLFTMLAFQGVKALQDEHTARLIMYIAQADASELQAQEHGAKMDYWRAQTAWYQSAMQPDAMGTPRRG